MISESEDTYTITNERGSEQRYGKNLFIEVRDVKPSEIVPGKTKLIRKKDGKKITVRKEESGKMLYYGNVISHTDLVAIAKTNVFAAKEPKKPRIKMRIGYSAKSKDGFCGEIVNLRGKDDVMLCNRRYGDELITKTFKRCDIIEVRKT